MAPLDVNDFLNQETSEPTQTKLVLVPPGVYKAQLAEFTRPKEFLDDKTNAPTGRAVIDVMWEILDPTGEVAKVTNNPKNTVKQALFVDLLYSKQADGSLRPSGLDFGTNRNLPLGRLREALNMNTAGSFRPAQMKGQIAAVEVKWAPDKNKPDIMYAQVEKVAPASSIQ